jgi:hypothetical protein
MALLRHTFTLVAIAIIGGLITFAWSTPPADVWGPGPTRARIPDPPALPCPKQIWPSADRVCLTWTAPLEATDVPAISQAATSDRTRDLGRQP